MSYTQLLEAYQALQAQVHALTGAADGRLDKALQSPEADPATVSWLQGGGVMGERIRAFDWANHALGPLERWPRSLQITMRLMLTSRYAMWMGWGPELYFFCNDAYLPTVGLKERWVLGASARTVWAEIWSDIGPRAASVLTTGRATWDEALLLFLQRRGYTEETYHTFSYSPVTDDTGTIGGMLCVVTEETERVIGERRMALLRDLAAALTQVKTEAELFEAVQVQLRLANHDLPFAVVYLFDASGQQAHLVCVHGAARGEAITPPVLSLEPADMVWPARAIRLQAIPVMVSDLAARFPELPTAPWDIPARHAVVVPIAQQGQAQPAGFLVAGLNPYRPFDAAYAGFINLLAGQIGSALANARAYEAERQRAEALADLDRAKTLFFSNVSHEFRTPLTLMLGPLADALADYTTLQPQTRTQLELAQRNGLRLLKLVNSLLDFSRIEAGRIDVCYEPVDLATYSAELASLFRAAVEKAGLRLVVDCPPLPQPVYVDRTMWEKIVLNLLSNAFKFTFEGTITVRLRASWDMAVLTVSDTGTGIPADDVPHLFERFYRVHGAHGRSIEGSGIGLSLVQELVRLHGGEVRVSSALQVGSTFTVSLPLGTAHLPAERIGAAPALISTALSANAYVTEALHWLPEALESSPLVAAEPRPHQTAGLLPHVAWALPRARVLLADDNADMRAYLRRLLATQYDVVAVADGQAALEALREQSFDLVLTDVMMPQLDGFGLLKALRADARTREVPVMILSARAGEEARVEGLQAGADDYLVKPFAARELLARVDAHLQQQRLRRAAMAREQALRETAQAARQQLDAIFDAAPLGIYLVDADFRLRQVNPTALQVFGDIPELLGRDFAEVMHHLWSPAYAAEIVRRFRHTLTTGEPYVTPEHSEARRDRGVMEYYEWHIHRIPLPDGRPGVVCYFRDIAAQVAAQQAIAASEARYRQLAATLDQQVQERTALLALSQDLTRAANEAPTSTAALQWAVDRVCAHTGWPVGHVYLAVEAREAAWAPSAIWHLDAPEHFASFQQATQELGPLTDTGLVGRVGARGQPEWCREVATDPTCARSSAAQQAGLRTGVAWPLLVGSEVAGVLEFYSPVSLPPQPALLEVLSQIGTQLGRALERERAATQAQRQQEALLQREKLAAMTTLLASVAHELNNPLATLVLQAEILRDDLRDGPLAETVSEMSRAAARCERLVRQFLTLAREHPPERTAVMLATLVTETVELLAYPFQVDNITVHLELDAAAPSLWGDPHQLQQVLLNLLSNAQQALRATAGSRDITLRTQYDAVAQQLTLTVTDTGPGIPLALHGRIFEPFFTTKPLGVGTGLGLSLCRGMVEAHGGTLEVSSAPGQGATFRVALPVESMPTTSPARPQAAEAPTVQRGTILVVEDEASLANGLARLLRRDGHRVELVANGRLALEQLATRAYDLILCDVRMPELDGPGLYRVLERQQPQLCARLIFLTGDTLEPATRTFLSQTGAPCLTKPFAIAEARRLIQRTLQGDAMSAPRSPL
ncbi:MAG: ATP-binding protein [Candidatus Tectimicrobiota bacterium]